MAEYTASKPGLWMVESVIRLISIMLPDEVTSRGLEGGLWPHFLPGEERRRQVTQEKGAQWEESWRLESAGGFAP